MMEKLRRFLSGRYGTDQLCIALVIVSMAIALIGRIAESFFVQIPAYLLLIWALVRSTSRNFAARRHENEIFMRFWSPVEKWFRLQKNRFRDRKTHRYLVCPKCRNTLRVPKGRGEITITCPVCKERFDRKV